MEDNNVLSYFEIQDDPILSGKLVALYTFAMVSQYKSIRAAAKKMYISPQALNKQIVALEEKLGLPLIKRSPRGFSLTRYGEHVYQYATNLLQDTQQLRHDLTVMYAEHNNLVRLAYSDNVYDTALHIYMREFKNEEPTCTMKLVRGNYKQTLDVANGKEPYITVTTRPADTENFDVTVLHNAQYYLLVHKDSPLAGHKEIDISEFTETPLILCSEFFRANQYLLKYCTEKKITTTVLLETGGFQAGVELCKHNKGVLLFVDYLEGQVDTEGLLKIPPSRKDFFMELVMMVRKDLDYSIMEQKFIEYMKAYSPRQIKSKPA